MIRLMFEIPLKVIVASQRKRPAVTDSAEHTARQVCVSVCVSHECMTVWCRHGAAPSADTHAVLNVFILWCTVVVIVTVLLQ